MQDEKLHPQPQLKRAYWIDLRGEWGFAYDDAMQGLDEDWMMREEVFMHTIHVPFPPESPASGINDRGFHPVVWYRRTFRISEDCKKRIILHCGAVDYAADVWMNGQHVASHEGGNTPFSCDITTTVQGEGEQVLVLRAQDLPQDLSQPRGKQDWLEQPHSIWYHRTTGIWQPIWLEAVHPTHISTVRWTPDLERGLLGMVLHLHRQHEKVLQMRVQLRLGEVLLADDRYVVQEAELQREIALDRASMMQRERLLWSPDHPNLIDATITVYEGNEVLDEVLSYIGLRSVGVDNGRFLLNGHPYYLRFVLEQGYWPESHLAAPSDEALRREVELVKELGFNGIRIHQKVEDPRFLYWCDQLGLLVWGEMANSYIFSPVSVQRLTREWMEVLERDYNHPCIVAWVPINESWGVPNVARDAAQRSYVQGLYHLTKALDSTRPTIGNDGWEHLISDIYSVHDYSFDGQTLRERYGSSEAVERTLQEVQPGYRSLLLAPHHRTNEPIMLTEWGGIGSRPRADTPWFGYGTVTSSEALVAKYSELLDAIVSSSVIAGFCYTQLTDTEQETNGLLTSSRVPKADPAVVCQITQRLSAAVAGDVIKQMQKMEGITPFASGSVELPAEG